MAVKLKADQRTVWDQVAAAQARLSTAMNISARSEASPTSFAMTMEAPAVRRSIDRYIQGRASVRDLTARTQVITKETAQNVVFKTRDREQGGAWIHRNYMTK
jgi:hypothetical protein